jgi:hypothetical protein
MVALTENDIIPDIQNIVNEGAWWLYFCPWYGDFLTSSRYNDPTLLNTIYNSKYVITLDELPADLYEFTQTVTPTPTPVSSFDLNYDGAINMADVIILAKVFNSVRGDSRYVDAVDLNKDGAINMSDVIMIASKFNTVV